MTEEQALHLTYEYLFSDDPYSSMARSRYTKLWNIKNLPRECFVPWSKAKKLQLFHSRRINLVNKKKKITHSGILSCSDVRGVSYFSDNFSEGSFLFPVLLIESDIVVDARKVVKCIKKSFSNDSDQERMDFADSIAGRVENENEYMVVYRQGLIPQEFQSFFRKETA